MVAGAKGQVNPRAMDKCSNARTPSCCYTLGYSLTVDIGLLVWTDAVCSSAPYRFNIGKNVKVKVIYNILSAEATVSELGRCRRDAMCVLLMMIYVAGICDTYGTG